MNSKTYLINLKQNFETKSPSAIIGTALNPGFMIMNLAVIVFAISNSTTFKLKINLKIEAIAIFLIIFFGILLEKVALKVFTGTAAVIMVSSYLSVRSIFFIVFEESSKIFKR